MRATILFVATAVAGCTAEADTVLDVTFDACAPLAIAAIDATSDQAAAIVDATALWRSRGAPGVGDDAAPLVLDVVFEPAGPGFNGYYDDELGVVYVNDRLTREHAAIVVAHELGHAFGLWHVDERPSVMNRGNLETAPTVDDQVAVEAIWGSCNAPATQR